MHADQVNQVFLLGISSAYQPYACRFGLRSVYIREVQTSGSLFGRVGNLFYFTSPIPGCGYCFAGRRWMYVGGEGTVGSAGSPANSILKRHMLPGEFQSISVTLHAPRG